MKRIYIFTGIVLGLAILVIAVFWIYKFGPAGKDVQIACTMEAKMCPDGSYVGRSGPKCEFTACPEEVVSTEAEARAIAEKYCIKGGEALSLGAYLPDTGNWRFEANLNAKYDNCSAYCIADTKAKAAGLGWECKSLNITTGPIVDAIKLALKNKNPKFNMTAKITIDQQTPTNVLGNTGPNGGYFFARLFNGQWVIDLDGNGAIPCSLSEKGYTASMLLQCYDDKIK